MTGVVIATDSDEVAELCHQNHWPVELTSADLPSGTDRVHAVAQHLDADIYVNIQGDEPLLRPEHLAALLRPFVHPHVEVSTLKVLCTPENIANPNAVKVVTAADGRALYFSRATIPYDRDGTLTHYWKHIGLYAYRRATLNRFPTLPPSALEQTERLEQLRFLENGIAIYVEPTNFDTIGVDTEEDLRRVEALLLSTLTHRAKGKNRSSSPSAAAVTANPTSDPAIQSAPRNSSSRVRPHHPKHPAPGSLARAHP